MIGTIKIQLNAAHPNLALQPLYAFVGSPSNLRIIDVPKKIGNWQITEVYVSYNYPDNTQQTLPCTLVGGAYVCTLPASSAVGASGLGYSVVANGVDENENPVNGYVLGKGDIVILDIEAAISTGEKANYVNLLSAQRETPVDGDMWQTADGGYVIWQDGAVHELNVPFEAISAFVENQLSDKVDEDELTAYATISSLTEGTLTVNHAGIADEASIASRAHFANALESDDLSAESRPASQIFSQIDSKVDETQMSAYVESQISGKVDGSTFDGIVLDITQGLNNKADTSALTAYATADSLSSYYTKSETSSATEIRTAFSQPAKMTYMITPDEDGITGEKFVPLSQAAQRMANGVAFFEVEAFGSAFTLQADMFDGQVTFYYEQQGSYQTLTIPSGHSQPMFRITMIDAMVGSASTPGARFALVEYIGEGNL